jgi:hypothetical protein
MEEFHVFVYLGYKKEYIPFDSVDEIYNLFSLFDPTKFVLRNNDNIENIEQTHNNYYFISNIDSMHKIIFSQLGIENDQRCNNQSIEIPIDMNVHEFQAFIGLYGDVYNITNNSRCIYYPEDTFTSNGKYCIHIESNK